jgi:hypothetical protein
MNSKKRVKFNCFRDIWVIPNTDDIINEGLKDQLWWSECETAQIKHTALMELEKIYLVNRCRSRKNLHKTIWYELDFDKIYEILDDYKLTRKIELKKLYELYTIK